MAVYLLEPVAFAAWAADVVAVGVAAAQAECDPGPDAPPTAAEAYVALLRALMADGQHYEATCVALAFAALNGGDPRDADGLYHALRGLSGPRRAVREFVAAEAARSRLN